MVVSIIFLIYVKTEKNEKLIREQTFEAVIAKMTTGATTNSKHAGSTSSGLLVTHSCISDQSCQYQINLKTMQDCMQM